MTTAGYDVIFDISQQSFDWMNLAHFAAMTVIGLGIAAVSHSNRTRAVGVIFAAASFVLLVGAAGLSAFELHRLQSAYSDGRFTVAEGVAQGFRPDAHRGQQAQAFNVQEHFFAMRPEHGPGFDRTVGQGGPNLSGKCVQVAFIEPNEILWLGVREGGCAPLPIRERESVIGANEG